MELLTGFVADAANLGEGQKINACGIFHMIPARTVPARHPAYTLVIEMQAATYDRGKDFAIQIRFMTPDGHQQYQIDATLHIEQNAPALEPVVPLCVNIVDQVLPEFGSYNYEVFVNGSRRGKVSFELVETQQPAQQ